MELFEGMGNIFIALVMWGLAIGGIMLWAVCAGARLGEGCEPEHDCSNCGHQERAGHGVFCGECVRAFPATPQWTPILEKRTFNAKNEQEAA